MSARQFFARYVLAAAIAAPFATLAAQAPTYKWGPAPAVFPAGARMAVLQGDPGKAEYFTVRLEFPSGYRIAPHWHPTDEAITVISGTFVVGMGDAFDRPHMMTLPTGGFAVAGANMHHYAEAKGKTVVQVSAMGPFAMTYVNAADDPTKKGGKE
jgi:quercetin dioxygenase-like cupin family protein